MILFAFLITALAPFAIMAGVTAGDAVSGALIAGVFSVVNTILNARMLRKIAEVNQKVGAAKASARLGVDALNRLADEHIANGPGAATKATEDTDTK